MVVAKILTNIHPKKTILFPHRNWQRQHRIFQLSNAVAVCSTAQIIPWGAVRWVGSVKIWGIPREFPSTIGIYRNGGFHGGCNRTIEPIYIYIYIWCFHWIWDQHQITDQATSCKPCLRASYVLSRSQVSCNLQLCGKVLQLHQLNKSIDLVTGPPLSTFSRILDTPALKGGLWASLYFHAPGAVAVGIVLPHGQPSPTVPDELKLRVFGLGLLMMPLVSTVGISDLGPKFPVIARG